MVDCDANIYTFITFVMRLNRVTSSNVKITHHDGIVDITDGIEKGAK